MRTIITEEQELPQYHTISLSHTGAYEGLSVVFDQLAQWATDNNLWVAWPKTFAVYYDDPMMVAPSALRSKACIQDLGTAQPAAGMERTTISGGKYFVYRVEVVMAEFGAAWKDAYSEFNNKGYQYDHRDHYEQYVSCPEDMQNPNAPWVVDLCIPMK